MSHIVKGKVTVAYKDETLLRKALETLGIVVENERLYVALGGGSYSKAAGSYDLVLVNKSNSKFRIGYRNENGEFNQYQENWGEMGSWTREVSSKVSDRYLAFHYEQQLTEEGFNVTVQEHNDGTLELVAEEAVW